MMAHMSEIRVEQKPGLDDVWEDHAGWERKRMGQGH